MKPRRICGAPRRQALLGAPVFLCGGTFKAAIERQDENGKWVLGHGARMRLSPTHLECQQCGRITT